MPRLIGCVAALGMALGATFGCDDRDRATRPPTTAPAAARRPAIASFVPAATDLLVGMGAADHLAAVSDYDADPAVERLPRVGAYERQDWEKLQQIRPDVLITNYAHAPVPAALRGRAAAMGANILNLTFDRLADIDAAVGALGAACDERARAARELQSIHAQIDSVRQRVAGRAAVRAVIATGPSGKDLAGRQTYLDDLLQAAGGTNAVTTPGYLTLDPEALAALKPDVVLLLMPGEDARTAARAQAFWAALPDVPAARGNRIHAFTEPYIMIPGSHVGEVSARFAEVLHPDLPAVPARATTSAAVP